ncbi:MAG TPA: hypothetical protein VL309_05875 [Vicinamibacterales bacterium]|jgi:hypothetical protein|nr:hypothetical protein [Vicinamibacterales bacterium]
MNGGKCAWSALIGLLVAFAGGPGLAQSRPAHFEGKIDDHTTMTAGSWEMHGTWSLDIKGDSGKADFTAALDMERADFFFVNPGGNPNDLTVRNAHTHHIAMADGAVSLLANGFRLAGAAALTGNGSTPPFGTSSSLQVDVTGGNLVEFSNVALTFSGDAQKHFGANPIAGVVTGLR